MSFAGALQTVIDRSFDGSRNRIFAFSLAIALVLSGLLNTFVLLPNHDNYWLLTATSRMLGGGGYLADYFEINPPLVMVLYAPAVLVSEAVGLDPYLCFRLLILIYAAVSLLILKFIVDAFYPRDSIVGTLLPPIAAAVVLLIPGTSFGQREHLISIFLLPYLAFHGAFAWRDRPPARAAALIATWTSIGLFLKPPFLLLPILMALCRAVARRSFWAFFDADMLAFALLGVGYICAVLIFFPDYMYVAGMAAQIYGAYNIPMNEVLKKILPYLVMGLVPFVAAPFLNCRPLDRRVIFILFLAMTVSGIAVIVQHKAFAYHSIPIKAFCLIAALSIVPMAVRHASGELVRWVAVVPTILSVSAVSLFLAAQTARNVLTHTVYDFEHRPLFSKLYRVAAHRPIFVFSTSVAASFPMVPMVHGIHASRFSSLWLVPGFVYAAEHSRLPPERIEELRVLARQYVEEDFRRYLPDVVLVDRREVMQGFAEHFDMLAFFTASPSFSQIWQKYTLLEHADRFDIYVLSGQAPR